MTPRKLTQKYVKELFDYQDGLLYWKQKRGRQYIGSEAGCIDSHNTRMAVRIDNRVSPYARVVFLWHHGYEPARILHKDGNTLNNKIENLIAVERKSKIEREKDRQKMILRKQLKKKL